MDINNKIGETLVNTRVITLGWQSAELPHAKEANNPEQAAAHSTDQR